MRCAQIGSLMVSRVGFGCYGMAGAYGVNDRATWQSQVELALDLGITLYDTAPSYGQAELWLGQWLKPCRQHVVIATKCGIGPDRVPDASASAVLRQCQASLKRLGTDWLDLLLVHFDDPSTPVAETVTALDALKRGGMIREYGVGHLPLERVREYLRLGQPAAVMCELHLAAAGALAGVVPAAQAAGAGVIAFSPTGRGLLTGMIGASQEFGVGDIRHWDPLFAPERRTNGIELARALAAAGAACEPPATAAQAAVAWVLGQGGVVAALTGTGNPAHLRENVAAATLELPQSTVSALHQAAQRRGEAAVQGAVAAMRSTLAGPVPTAAGPAAQYARQLLAAMETALETDLAGEAEVTPLALRLLRPGREQQPLSHEELDRIRQELAALVG